MWSRSSLKAQAKGQLNRKYWNAFAVTLITSLLSGGSSIFTWRFDASDFKLDSDSFSRFFSQGRFFHFDRFYEFDPELFFQDFWQVFNTRFFFLAILIGLLAGSIGIIYNIFVSPVIQVGGNRWFSRSREAEATPAIGQVFSLFRAGSYLKTVGSMLWMNLFLFLWGLLAAAPVFLLGLFGFIGYFTGSLLAPGMSAPDNFYDFFRYIAPFIGLLGLASVALSIPLIIKIYSYRMTPWILADNPKIGYKRALQLSISMTRGHKFNMFVLDLSFIGWFLLGGLLCGIGVFFVMPYYQAVQAELFAVLRQNSVESQESTMEEFGYVRIDNTSDTEAESVHPGPAAEQ